MAKRLICLFAVVSTVVLAGCGGRQGSQTCSADSDCATGLSCLGFALFASDGGCSENTKACSHTCSTDADCASLGASFKCFASCGNSKFCGATQ